MKNLEKETDILLTGFANHLLRTKGFTQQTIDKHLQHLEFFGENYLNEYMEDSLLDVWGPDIEDYVGNWYIRKVLNSHKSDVGPILTSFKQFYKYLSQSGKISADQYEDIAQECKQSHKFLRRFDGYENFDWDGENADERFEEWMSFAEPETDDPLVLPFQYPPVLRELLSRTELNEDARAFLADIITLLRYCGERASIKLTKAHNFFNRQQVLAMNRLVATPEVLPSTINQWDAKFIHFFYNIGMTLGLIAPDDHHVLCVSPKLEEFLALPQCDQLCLIIEATWNLTPWKKFKRPNSGGRPEWEQNLRRFVAIAFYEASMGQETPFRVHFNDIFQDYSHNIMQQSKDPLEQIGFGFGGPDLILYTGVFVEMIMPLLQRMGLLTFKYAPNREDFAIKYGWGIETFQVTHLGKEIFTVLSESRGE